MRISRRTLLQTTASTIIFSGGLVAGETSFDTLRMTVPPSARPTPKPLTDDDIQECIEGARLGAPFETISTHAPHAIGRSLRLAALRRYVHLYVEQNGQLPTGPHTISATYGPRGADLFASFSNSIKSLTVKAMFAVE